MSAETINLIAFVFAGNAVILGNAVGIAYYMSGTSIRRQKRYKFRAILNNQTFLVGCYFFWYFEVVTFIGDYSGLLNIYGVFEYAWEICVLLFTVLFLESVKELRRSFKEYTTKILLLHFLLICSLIFMCSMLKRSNYNQLSAMYEKSNPYISLPQTKDTLSHGHQVLRSKYEGHRICRERVKVLKNSNGISYWIKGNEIAIDDLVNGQYTCWFSEEDDRAEYFVFADGTIAYSQLKELENKASLKGMFAISYAIYATTEDNEYVFSKVLFPSKTFYEKSNFAIPPPPPVYHILENKKEIPIVLDTYTTKSQIDTKKVYNYFRESVSDSVFFKFKISKEITLQQYLDFMIAYKQSVYDLRAQYGFNKILDFEENAEVRKKYPFYFLEEVE